MLKKLDITSISNLRTFISKFNGWSWFIFIISQVLISTLIFVIPFEDELWVTLSIILFGAKTGFVLSTIAIMLVSLLLYLLGRNFGTKLASKFVGEETVVSMQNKLEVKGKLSLPFIYFIPFLPHDALCLVAGLSKMNFWYFFVITLLIRPIEILAVCFLGGGIIDWKTLSTFDYLLVTNIAIVDFYLLKKLAHKMESKLQHKRAKDNNLNNKIEKND